MTRGHGSGSLAAGTAAAEDLAGGLVAAGSAAQTVWLHRSATHAPTRLQVFMSSLPGPEESSREGRGSRYRPRLAHARRREVGPWSSAARSGWGYCFCTSPVIGTKRTGRMVRR